MSGGGYDPKSHPKSQHVVAEVVEIASPPKPWWQSKTIVVNLLVVVAASLTELAGWLGASGLGSGWALVALGVVNTVLRFITTRPIDVGNTG
jgi:hypothetical protein